MPRIKRVIHDATGREKTSARDKISSQKKARCMIFYKQIAGCRESIFAAINMERLWTVDGKSGTFEDKRNQDIAQIKELYNRFEDSREEWVLSERNALIEGFPKNVGHVKNLLELLSFIQPKDHPPESFHEEWQKIRGQIIKELIPDDAVKELEAFYQLISEKRCSSSFLEFDIMRFIVGLESMLDFVKSNSRQFSEEEVFRYHLIFYFEYPMIRRECIDPSNWKEKYSQFFLRLYDQEDYTDLYLAALKPVLKDFIVQELSRLEGFMSDEMYEGLNFFFSLAFDKISGYLDTDFLTQLTQSIRSLSWGDCFKATAIKILFLKLNLHVTRELLEQESRALYSIPDNKGLNDFIAQTLIELYTEFDSMVPKASILILADFCFDNNAKDPMFEKVIDKEALIKLFHIAKSRRG